MKQFAKTIYWILIIILCTALLAGCSGNGDQQETAPSTQLLTPGTEQKCTVTFVAMNRTLEIQELNIGMIPYEVDLQLTGLAMYGWHDASGKICEPFATEVYRDTTYTALLFPALKSHTPFLFADENNNLRPDENMTPDMLAQALEALAEDGAKSYYPQLPAGAQAMQRQALLEIMGNFFPAKRIESVFTADGEYMTRSEFAQGLLQLLYFDPEETLTVYADSVFPADIARREDSIYLLEASVAHSYDGAGTTWEETGYSVQYDPGFVNIGGWLYYVQEDKTFLCNGSVGDFTFGADGRYTSGDAELDQIVAQILDTIIDLQPDAEPMDWLYAAYEYSRDSFEYLGRNNHKEIGRTDWGAEDAKVMLTTKRGNCYNYAAAFWALARGLGYDAQVMSGVVLKDRQDHGWVFLTVDGTRYLCDPEWEMVYRYERDDFTKDMFMLEMAEIGWWNYDWTP